MAKKDIILQLRQAKSAHIQWRSYAQALIAGLDVGTEHVPVIHTDCKFGKWYYGPGQRLSGLGSFSGIDTPHEMLHQLYMRIFKLLFSTDDRSMMAKLFGSKAKLKQQHLEEAEVLMNKLMAVSETLLEAIKLLEEEVNSMSEEELEAMM